jgi:hypothetical protein
MVAYAYAAGNRHDVTKLVLSEAPIPDLSIYQFPALTANGPGLWNFGFSAVNNGRPEETVRGHDPDPAGLPALGLPRTGDKRERRPG